jgi:hypothetical protein
VSRADVAASQPHGTLRGDTLRDDARFREAVVFLQLTGGKML